MSVDPRVPAARALLRDVGFPDADVEVAGHDRAIAVITHLELADLPVLARLAAGFRQIGFRYLTLEITERGG